MGPAHNRSIHQLVPALALLCAPLLAARASSQTPISPPEQPKEAPSEAQTEVSATANDALLREQLQLARAFVGTLEVKGPHQGSIMRQTTAFLIEPGLAVTSAMTLSGGHGLTLRIGGESRTATVCGLDLMQDVALLALDPPLLIPAGLPLQAANLVGNERVAILGNTVLMEEVAQIGNLTGAIKIEPLGSIGQLQNLTQQGMAGTPLLNARGRVVGMLSSRIFRKSGTRFVISGATIAQIPRSKPVLLSQSLVPALPGNGQSEAYTAWVQMERGVNELLAGHATKAIKTLKGLPSERARMWLALALSEAKRHVESLEIVEALILEKPESVELLLMQGVAKQHIFAPDQAAACFQRARSKEPNNLNASMLLAEAYFRMGRGQEGLQSLGFVLRAQPGFVPALLLRGQIMNNRLRFPEARAAFEQVLELDPRNPYGWVGLGQMHLEEGQPKPARAAFETARKLDPGNLDAEIGLCQVLVKRKQWQKALDAMTPLLAKHPQNVSLLTQAAYVNTRLRNLEEALALYETATFLEPDNIDSHMGMGLTYQEMMDYDRAIMAFDRILSINSQHGAALFSAGFCHLMLNDRGKARARYKLLAPIDPIAADRLYKMIYDK